GRRRRDGTAHAGQRRGTGRAVAAEDVAPVIQIVRDQVAGATREGDVATVGGDRGRRREPVAALRAALRRAHQYRRGGHVQPAHEHVGRAVAVVGYQIAGVAGEEGEPAVSRDRHHVGLVVAAVTTP